MKKKKNKNLRYDKISTYFILNKWSFIFSLISGIIYNVLMVFVPIIQGKLIDAFQEQKDSTYIIKFALIFLLFVIFIQVNRYFKRFFVRDFANRMVLEMRTVSFNNLITDDIKEYNKTTKGDIMNKELSDIKDSAEGVRKILTEVYDTLILMTGYAISLFVMDYKVSLIVLVFVIISVSVANLMKKVIYKSVSEYKKKYSESKDVTLSALKNEVYYRGFGVSKNYYNKYKIDQDKLEKKSIKSMIYKDSLEPTYQAIALIGLFFVIYMCGKKVMDNIWLIGTFSAYLSTFVLVARKASKLGKLFNAATTLKVSWKRCLPYLRSNQELKEIIIDDNDKKLKVENLEFGFDDKFVLKNISFNLDHGEMLGICGMIHSGKSTLGAALSGIYDYKGSIKLDNVELKDNKNSIKDNFISYAPSNVELFNDSLNYNVSFNDDNIVDISDALRIACFDKDVNELNNKDKEILSHSIYNLSGGEEKRLQIARCVYNKPSLIILDDPFNAIDIKMSEEITDNIKNECKESITVIINNQKEIIKKMDKVLFLKNDGSYLFNNYDELLKDNDFYKLMEGER